MAERKIIMKTWPTKKLGDVIVFLKGKKMSVTEEQRLGYEPYIGIDTLRTREYKLFTLEKNGVKCSKDDVLVVWDGAYAGTVGIEVSGFAGSTVAKVVIREPELDSHFLRYFWELSGTKIRNAAQGAAIPHLSKPFINNIKIPLPPLAIQKQVVERLDKVAEAQKLNDELIQKTDELFQSLLHKELNPVRDSKHSNGVNPAGPADAKAMAGKKDWEIKNIGEVCKIIGGGTPSREELKHFKGDIPWVTVKDLNVLEIEDTLEHINKESLKNSAANLVPAGTVLVVTRVGLGKVAIAKKSLTFNQDIKGLIANAEIDPSYLFYIVLNKADKIIRNGKGATVKGITQEFLKSIKIFLPPLKIQKQIVAKLSAVQDYKKQLLEQKSKLKELFDSALAKSMASEKKSKDD